MKHRINNPINHKEATNKCKEIITKLDDTNSLTDKAMDELVDEIHGIVLGNMIVQADKEVENERFATLIKLARVFDDETLSKTINVLGYTLNVK